ncbi:hypothetical protein GCM10009795_017530 [Nocardioides hankookensis]|uniref:Uncharacterized protein n=1 Tax=Nocardioides hankookensis TaxID=443157 RepID=A0ABW1LL80_9ACTN
MTGGPLADFLACADLDALPDACAALPTVPDDSGEATAVVAAWSDVQALANLLICAPVLPVDVRTNALLRALRGTGYLRLAATVGVGQVDAGSLPDDVRRDLLDALLDVVASDAGPAGIRASAELGPLIHRDELELLDDLAAHPVDAVRHNLVQAALGVTAPERQEPVLLPYLPDYPTYVADA